MSSTPTVAIIGGGQLARMMAQSAVALGVPLRLLAEAEGVSAAQVIADTLVGDYRDLETLRKVTDGCSVVTFDHEHVPTEHLHTLTDEGHACRPGPEALVHAQDKAVMRERLTALDVPCPRHAVVEDADAVERFAATVGGFPVVLKTTRGGYDGKGVWVVGSAAESAEAFETAAASGVRILAEEKVDFRRDLLRLDGELDVTGILAVELFETRDGRVLVNELAMRPHNTGHWSMDGAVTGQFENHLRAVLDLPLGSPEARAPWTVMVNILGGDDERLAGDLYAGYPHVLARDPRLKVHLYGKAVKPGRKVGHVTAYGDDLEEVRERALHAAAWFRGELGEESA